MGFYKNTNSGSVNILKKDIEHLHSMYEHRYFTTYSTNDLDYIYLQDNCMCPDPILYWTNLEEIFNHLIELDNIFHIESFHIERGYGRVYIKFSSWLGLKWFTEAVRDGKHNGFL